MLLAAMFVFLILMSPTKASASIVDAGWQYFGWGAGVPAIWDSNYAFTLSTAAVLKVTDCFMSGDQFRVFDQASTLGDTSLPGAYDWLGDPDSAFASPNFSHGQWDLAAGYHDIWGQAILNPYGYGGAYLRVDTRQGPAIPEPATMSLLGLGLFGLAGLRKRNHS